MSKVAVIGGAGRVGISFAFHLITQNICQELALLDVNEDQVMGERLDLMHATSEVHYTKITAGTGPELLHRADVIVIPAGARRRPDQSRLDLIRTNCSIIDHWMEMINQVNRTAIVLIVVNPVDVLTYRAYMKGSRDRRRIFGLGNVMDTVRIRSNLAERFGWEPRYVNGYMLGEHGDSIVPVWSQFSYAGMRFKDMPQIGQRALDEVFDETRKAGAEVIRLKGGAGWGVGVAITMVVKAILLDERRVLCVSSVPDGAYGINEDVALSLPTIVGANGVEGYLEVKLDAAEQSALENAARVLRDTYRQVAGEDAPPAAAAAPASLPTVKPAAKPAQRPTPAARNKAGTKSAGKPATATAARKK
jgi:L-lactate dehydrogenase